MEIIDMHCHILPGIDDGAPDEETTRAMLGQAWEHGTVAMVATPHKYKRRGFWPSDDAVVKAYNQARRIAQEIDPAFVIFLGSEVGNSSKLDTYLQDGQYRTIAGSKYLLIEFSPSDPFEIIQRSLQTVQMNGYKPILAHCERYDAIVEEPERLEELSQAGVLLQLNADSILGKRGRKVKKFCLKALKKNLISFIGSDAHDLTYRPPVLDECYEFIEKKFGTQRADALFNANIAKVIMSSGKF